MSVSSLRWSAGIALAAMVNLAGCSNLATQYDPRIVARGEMTLRYTGRFEMHAGGRRVARGLTFRGLTNYVDCVPEAKKHARRAENSGSASIVLAALGATFGVGALAGLAGFAEPEQRHLGYFLGGGVASAVLGVVLASVSRLEKNRANGAAVDAMNYYNDAVGSLGATCDDLRYPAPAGPADPPPPSLP